MNKLSVAAAFLRRDFRINISYRASFALQSLAIVFPLALFFYLSRVVDDSCSRPPGPQRRVLRLRRRGAGAAHDRAGEPVLVLLQAPRGADDGDVRGADGHAHEPLADRAFQRRVRTDPGDRPGLLLIGAAVVLFGLRLQSIPGRSRSGGWPRRLPGLFASLGVAVAAFTVVFKRATALLGWCHGRSRS